MDPRDRTAQQGEEEDMKEEVELTVGMGYHQGRGGGEGGGEGGRMGRWGVTKGEMKCREDRWPLLTQPSESTEEREGLWGGTGEGDVLGGR